MFYSILKVAGHECVDNDVLVSHFLALKPHGSIY